MPKYLILKNAIKYRLGFNFPAPVIYLSVRANLMVKITQNRMSEKVAQETHACYNDYDTGILLTLTGA